MKLVHINATICFTSYLRQRNIRHTICGTNMPELLRDGGFKADVELECICTDV